MNHINIFIKKKKKREQVCLIKPVLQEEMVTRINYINKDGEGKDSIAD